MTAVGEKSWGAGTPSVGAIVIAALELLDEHGLDALTTSRLAFEMGVHRPNLYRRISNIGELYGLISEEIVARAGLPDESITDWRERLSDCALRLLREWVKHPNAAPLVIYGGAHPALLRLFEYLGEVFLSGGFAQESVLAVTQSYFNYVFGAITAAGLARAANASPATIGAEQAELHPYALRYQQIVVRAIETPEDVFIQALDVVLDGIAGKRLAS